MSCGSLALRWNCDSTVTLLNIIKSCNLTKLYKSNNLFDRIIKWKNGSWPRDHVSTNIAKNGCFDCELPLTTFRDHIHEPNLYINICKKLLKNGSDSYNQTDIFFGNYLQIHLSKEAIDSINCMYLERYLMIIFTHCAVPPGRTWLAPGARAAGRSSSFAFVFKLAEFVLCTSAYYEYLYCVLCFAYCFILYS